MNNEPVVNTAAITAVVAAVIALLVAFGIELTQDQTAAILGLVAVVGPLVTAVIARRKVTPVNNDGLAAARRVRRDRDSRGLI